ncbi:MAG: hypothetical protein U1A78_37080 [Polyangia bacterium]
MSEPAAPPARPVPAKGPRLERALLGVLLCATALIPLCHRFLPMNDAPSHIATGAIARKLLLGDGFFAAHYTFQALPLPYWACTILMQGLQLVFDPLRAFAIVLAIYVVALPLGLRAVLRAVAPEDPAYVRALVLPGALAALNWAYWLGEVNFLLGQPVALFALALLLRSSSVRSRAFAGFVALVPIVYLCHIYALVALLIAAAGVVAPGVLQAMVPRRAEKSALWRLAAALPRPSRAQWLGAFYTLAHFAVAAYFVLFQHRTDANRGRMTLDLTLRKLVHVAIDPFDTLSGPAHFMTPLFVAALVVAAVLSLRARWREQPPETPRLERALGLFHLPLLVPALGLLLVACLGPAAILNEDGTLKEGEIAARFSLLGMLLGLGALRFRLVGRARGVFLGAIVVFGGLKTAECWRIHRAFQPEAQAFADEILAKVPPHSRLLPLFAVAHPSRADFVRHRMGSYVVPLRDGYSPHVFATLGQHPLRHRRGPEGRTGDWREVDELRLREDEWSFYGYVLVQTDPLEAAMDRVVPGLVQHAVPVAAGSRFHLYRLGPK